MPRTPTRTNWTNLVSGVYRSTCHGGLRTILEGQRFPRCGYCDSDTTWIFVRRAGSPPEAIGQYTIGW